jgi:hypothetical protein
MLEGSPTPTKESYADSQNMEKSNNESKSGNNQESKNDKKDDDDNNDGSGDMPSFFDPGGD